MPDNSTIIFILIGLIIIFIIADIIMTIIMLNNTQQKNQQYVDTLTNQLNENTKDYINAYSSTISNTLASNVLIQQQAIESVRHFLESSVSSLDKEMVNLQKSVDEKLATTLQNSLSKSFEIVSSRLEDVNKGLGEMQTLANGVGDLKKILTNVKTRGTFGEIQLSAILKEILSASQYDENVATIPGSANRVEFAIKIPTSDGLFVYLPIDSKFPVESYLAMINAAQRDDKATFETARKQLVTTFKQQAKDIHDKYVQQPYTTDFAIMFLPNEGLYCQAVEAGLLEVLQGQYRVSIAGPSTIASLLNALQMGFKTITIQNRSNEIYKSLHDVKTEFEKFEAILENIQTRMKQNSDDLDSLIGTRTRAINRKLKKLEENEDYQITYDKEDN